MEDTEYVHWVLCRLAWAENAPAMLSVWHGLLDVCMVNHRVRLSEIRRRHSAELYVARVGALSGTAQESGWVASRGPAHRDRSRPRGTGNGILRLSH